FLFDFDNPEDFAASFLQIAQIPSSAFIPVLPPCPPMPHSVLFHFWVPHRFLVRLDPLGIWSVSAAGGDRIYSGPIHEVFNWVVVELCRKILGRFGLARPNNKPQVGIIDGC